MADPQRLLSFGLSIAFPVLLGFAGARFTVNSVRDWYPSLTKPSWVPPNVVFPIAWTLLYASMGVASYRVALVTGWLSHQLSVYYAGSLVLNVSWSPIFFGLGWMDVALAVIVSLWAVVAGVLIPTFARVDTTAAALLVPYTAFLTFAVALNYRMLVLNPREVAWKGTTRLLAGRKGVKGAAKRKTPQRMSPQEL